MPRAELPTGASIYYEEHGSGYPVLLFAPGGMDSRIEIWYQWPFNPIEALSQDFRVIAMDQRNAHRSYGPMKVTSWADMVADQLALLDHLGIERAHVMGACIGSSYCLRAVHDAPERITAAVCQNPIGLNGGNFDSFVDMFEQAASYAEQHGMKAVIAAAQENHRFQQNTAGGYWAARIESAPAFRSTVAAKDPAEYARIHRQTAKAFFRSSDFVFSVSRDWLKTCPAPLLVLPGRDDFHPPAVAQEIVDLAPNATLIEKWGTPELKDQTVDDILAFLRQNTPA
jgi:pimeloyl-ACP methyl ester carboxylesterase